MNLTGCPLSLKMPPRQMAMDNIVRGLQNNICLVYLDDIIIFSTSLQEHIQNLKLVFDGLRLFNLKILLEKS